MSLDGVATKQQKVNKAAEALYKIYRAGGKLPPGVNFNGPLADKPEGPGWEKIKKKLLADHKKHATMADLQDSIAKIVLKNGSAAEKAAEQATGKEAKRTASSFAYQQQLQSLMATQKEQYALQENSLGLSDQEIQKRQEMIRLDQEYNRELSRITRDHTRGQINDQQYHDQISALNDYYSQMQTITEDHFKRMDTARQSWLTGLTRGLAQVRDNGLNQAAQMTDAVT